MSIFQMTLRTVRIIPPKLRKSLLILVFLLFIGSLLDLLGLAVILPFFRLVLEEDFIRSSPFGEWYQYFQFTSDNQFIIIIALLLVFAILIKNAILIAIQKFQSHYTFGVFKEIASKLYASAFNKGMIYLRDNNSNNIIRNILHIPRVFSMNFLLPSLILFNEIIVVAIILLSLLFVNPMVVFLLIVLISPLILIYLKYVRKKVVDLENKNIELLPSINKSVFDMIFGFVDIKISNSEEFFEKKYKHKLNKEVSQRGLLTVFSTIPNRIVELSALLAIVAIFVYGLIWIPSKDKLISLLSIFGLAAFRLIPSFNKIVQSLIQIRGKLYTLEYLSGVSYSEQNKVENTLLDFTDSIKISNVFFRYKKNQEYTFKNLDLIIKKGENIGVIGKSGSGKSTLVNLLLAFLDPNEGCIKIDETMLDERNANAWRNKIGYVSQEVFIIDGTFWENIAFGMDEDNLNKDFLNEIIARVSLSELVSSWKNGINTHIGERGAQISGGQKQRIAIARALYKRAEVLILDEATSSLDNQTEIEITEAINSLKKENLTIIIIAHRITTLRYCDKIYELESGSIKKIVKYENLIQNE